jgi:hypothetical protein
MLLLQETKDSFIERAFESYHSELFPEKDKVGYWELFLTTKTVILILI